MKAIRELAFLFFVTIIVAAGCGDDGTTKPADGEIDIDPSEFTSTVDNPYWPLVPGTTLTYEGESDGESERIVVEVTDQTKEILGVTCVVVRDRVWVDDELVEDTFDWYAQHVDGDVWYFGEDAKEIENGEVVSTEGSWEAGVDGAQPGVLMKADPRVGDSYRQEFLEGEAEDMAEVLSLDESVTVAYGKFTGCLQTREFTPLEPGVSEHKFYAPGVGLVLEVLVEGGEGSIELISVEGP